MILSVDPGLVCSGAALWTSSGSLVMARLERGTKGDLASRVLDMVYGIANSCGAVERLIVEKPQIYRQSPGDPNDLINISLIVGGLIGYFSEPAILYPPRQWKGNIKKDKMVARIQSRLTPEETGRVECSPKHLAHNAWDAVGLGLHYFKRL